MIKICEQGMLWSRKNQNTRGVKTTNGYFDYCPYSVLILALLERQKSKRIKTNYNNTEYNNI